MNSKFDYFSPWGPYSKKYAGISHIPENEHNFPARFDFSVAPAVSGFDIRVPNVTLPSAYHPWSSNEDYSFYSYRYDLEWKDKVYADVSYSRLSDESILVRTEIVNNSELFKNCVVNYFASAEYPDDSYVTLVLPKKSDFFDATDYDSYNYAIPRPWDNQNADGRKKGEFCDKSFVNEKGLGDRAEKWHMPHKIFKPFGGEKGDNVSYTFNIENNYNNAVLLIRYRTSDIKYEKGKMVGVNYIKSENTAEFLLNGKDIISLSPCDEPKIHQFNIGEIKAGSYSFKLEALGTGGAEFDFFALTEKENADEILIERKAIDFVPEIKTEKAETGYITTLKYDSFKSEYKIRTFDDNTRFRSIETGALEDCMSARLSNADETFDDVTESFTGAFKRKHSDNGFFHNEIVHTIFIPAGEKSVQYAIISNNNINYKSTEEYENIYKEKKATAIDLKLNKAGEKYKFSNQLLIAAVMTNVVYPIYKHGDYIIHHTPGKRWDCLYTWDSGFIGLGMNEYAPNFAQYILDNYLSQEDNPDYAFLHHGSPVPVQIYQLFEMLQKNNDKESYLAFYDRAKLYYDFLCGKIRNSTTAKFKSGILTTYDYFYSTSGMDDYPAQVAMMKEDVRDKASPVISTAQVIRFGKILKILADRLGKKEDISVFESDIERLTNALQKYSWDENSGYFSYVLHDENYEPKEIFTTSNGENLNKGLDGIYPIIAGACDENQKKRILSHLKSKEEMLSPYGISAVDMTAGYFKVNGYWNGNVWFPHQWFIWKSMLDCGETEFAKTIAKLAIDIWKREVDDSYYTFEMVSVVTGCGGWFHNFGGLSTPINMWTKAYYCPGTINFGFDSYIEEYNFNESYTDLKLSFTYYGNSEKFTMLAVMSDKKDYDIFFDGKITENLSKEKGLIEIELKSDYKATHKIEIKEK